MVVYNDKEAKSDAVLAGPTDVADGGTIAVAAPAGEDELKNDVSVYVDGERVAVFHTSCSRLIGPGTTEGGFTVVAGRDKVGRALCAVDLDECRGCGTGDDDAEKVAELTLEFLGEDDSLVQFYNDKDAHAEDLLFEGTLTNGETFTVEAPPEKDEFETDVSLYVDGTKNAEIHASCSQPLGPGILKGDFLVTGGTDRAGHPLCDVGCSECGEGDDDAEGITQLTLENSSGGDRPNVVVYNDKEAKSDAVLAGPTDVSTGETVTFDAPAGEDELKNDVSVYVDGSKDAEIHTSCSQPLGVGDVFGSFTVVAGRDKAGRRLCET